MTVAGLDGSTWVLVTVGLIVLAVLSVSILLAERFRDGRLVDIGTGDHGTFLPAAAMPVVLVALGLGMVLLLVGASRARWPIRILIAASFLLVNSPLSKPAALSIANEPALDLGPTVALIAFWSVAVIVLISILADRWALSRRISSWAVPPLLALAVVVFYGALLWVYEASERTGLAVYVPTLMNHTLSQVQTLLIPMVILSALGVIAFAYAASDGLVAPMWGLSRRVAAVVLGVVVVLKLWIVAVPAIGNLAESFANRPGVAAFTAAMLGLLLVGVVLLRRLPSDRESVGAVSERLLFAAAIVLAAPALITTVVVALQSLVLTQFGELSLAKAFLKFPFDQWVEYGDLLFWTPVLLVGVWLVRRNGRPETRELGGGLILVAVWELAWAITKTVGIFPGFDSALMDVLVTLLVVGFVVVRRRTLTAHDLVLLTGIVVFSWLVATQGDWIALIISPLGLPTVAVILIGLWWTVVAGSGFTWHRGQLLGRSSRALIWVGYLLLSLTMLQWFEVTHGVDITATAGSRAFVEIGIPIAAWLVARRPFSPLNLGRDVATVENAPNSEESISDLAPATG